MRLTRSHIKQLAKSFDLPLHGCLMAETRQMVEGKITELGKQPQNVHILIRRDEESEGLHLSLQDESEIFHEVQPEPFAEEEAEEQHSSREKDLLLQLETIKEENKSLDLRPKLISYQATGSRER